MHFDGYSVDVVAKVLVHGALRDWMPTLQQDLRTTIFFKGQKNRTQKSDSSEKSTPPEANSGTIFYLT